MSLSDPISFYNLPTELEERAKLLHTGAFIYDGACILIGFYKEEKLEIQAFLDGGWTAGNASLSTSETDFMMAIANINRFKALIETNQDKLALCATAAELAECKKSGKFGMVIHFQNPKPLLDNLGYVRTFYDLGLRVLQMSYNLQTFVGAGCCERGDNGLSHFGVDVVAECNRLGILADISHCGPKTSSDTIQNSKAPVVASHSGVYALAHSYGRNKPDDMLKAIAETGGLVGIPFQPCFVKRDPNTHVVQESTVEDVLDHIDYAVNLMGVDHVGIGTDMSTYAARTREIPRDSSILLYRNRHPEVFGVGPTDRYDAFPQGLDSQPKILNLTRGLVKRGYSDDDIRKVLGGNWMRVLKEVWRE